MDKKEKKEIRDSIRIILFTFVIVLVVSAIGIVSYFVLKDDKKDVTVDELKKNTQVIEGYGITVDDLDSEVYRAEFDKLKANLESGNINSDEYAKSIAKMFAIDLYTIKSKVNKYDVGGVDFVLEEGKANFITNVTDTIYNYVEDNKNGKRTQQLPYVSGVDIVKEKTSQFKINEINQTLDSYVFDIVIKYESDLGYDTSVEVTVVNRDNRMYVVEMN